MAVVGASCSDLTGSTEVQATTTPSTSVASTTSVSSTSSTTTAPDSGELSGDGALPAAPVVTTDPVWLADGVPQAGSVFRNLLTDGSLDGGGPVVALTFDDGPGPFTARVVDVLKIHGVPATFFQITNQVGSRQDLVKQMVADGFRVAAHTKGHVHLTKVEPLQQWDEIVGSADALDGVLGAGHTKCLRPPYGQLDLNTLDMAAKRGLAVAMWSLDTEDWKTPGVGAIVERTVDNTRDRSVILMHDGGGQRDQTIEALQWIIPALKDKGFRFVAVC